MSRDWSFKVNVSSGISEVSVSELAQQLSLKTDAQAREIKAASVPRPSFKIIDVRRPDEFTGELGHIPHAELVTLGDDLVRYLENCDRNQEIVFVCRSGGRSGQATQLSQGLGFQRAANLVGGMLEWNEAGFPIEK